MNECENRYTVSDNCSILYVHLRLYWPLNGVLHNPIVNIYITVIQLIVMQ